MAEVRLRPVTSPRSPRPSCSPWASARPGSLVCYRPPALRFRNPLPTPAIYADRLPEAAKIEESVDLTRRRRGLQHVAAFCAVALPRSALRVASQQPSTAAPSPLRSRRSCRQQRTQPARDALPPPGILENMTPSEREGLCERYYFVTVATSSPRRPELAKRRSQVERLGRVRRRFRRLERVHVHSAEAAVRRLQQARFDGASRLRGPGRPRPGPAEERSEHGFILARLRREGQGAVVAPPGVAQGAAPRRRALNLREQREPRPRDPRGNTINEFLRDGARRRAARADDDWAAASDAGASARTRTTFRLVNRRVCESRGGTRRCGYGDLVPSDGRCTREKSASVM